MHSRSLGPVSSRKASLVPRNFSPRKVAVHELSAHMISWVSVRKKEIPSMVVKRSSAFISQSIVAASPSISRCARIATSLSVQMTCAETWTSIVFAGWPST
jgi:hypothetical protein